MSKSRAIGIAATVTVFTWLFVGGLDFRMGGGTAGTSVAVALQPLTALLWAAAVAIVVLSQTIADHRGTERPAAWYRGFLALVVDFNLYLLIVAVPVLATALFYESLYLGEPVMAFERDFRRPSDRIVLLIALCAFPALWVSLSRPFMSGRSSPGSLAAGIVLTWTSKPPVWRSMLFGPFAYYAVAFPFFPCTFMARRLGVMPMAFRRTA